MKVLLLFFFVTYLLAVRSARRERRARAWPLLLASFLVGLSFLSLRVI